MPNAKHMETLARELVPMADSSAGLAQDQPPEEWWQILALPENRGCVSSSGGCPKCRAKYCGSNAYGVSGSSKFRRRTQSGFVARTRFGKMSPNACSITVAGSGRGVTSRMAVGRTS
jgi:hypothetical protein